MMSSTTQPASFMNWKWSLLLTFLIIGLLRLTNFNYYLSILVGLEVEVNNVGGNAFNFTNYFATGVLLFFIVSKARSFTTKWKTGWPFLILIGIYFVNAITAPFTNYSWVVYQLLFLLIGAVVHFLTIETDESFDERFRIGMRFFFYLSISLILCCLFLIFWQVSPSTYVSNFNDSFVQSLDDIGIMKQLYGYLLGFVIAYALFIEKRPVLRFMALLLVLVSGFGIRSFMLGLVGAGLIFSLRRPTYLIGFIGLISLVFYFFLGEYFELVIYDTRFYPYLNAFDIIQKYPAGVGLGGYQPYTSENARILFGAFYDPRAILDYVPDSPESDLVHLFGSLGLILGSLHLLIQLRLVWFTYRLQPLMNHFHKCVMFYFCFMTFFGISEDNLFSVNYWIFFGLASGVIEYLRHKRKNKLHYE